MSDTRYRGLVPRCHGQRPQRGWGSAQTERVLLSLRADGYEELRKAIVSGELLPGERLLEEAMRRHLSRVAGALRVHNGGDMSPPAPAAREAPAGAVQRPPAG